MARAKKNTQSEAPIPPAPAPVAQDDELSDAVVVNAPVDVVGQAEGAENAAVVAELPPQTNDTPPAPAPAVTDETEGATEAPEAAEEVAPAPAPKVYTGPTPAELEAIQAKQNAYAAQLRFERLVQQHPELNFVVERLSALEKENAELKARLGIK